MTATQPAPSFLENLRGREGVHPEAMIEIDRETGCYIGSAGFDREGRWHFLYHDNKHHLYFNTDRKWEDHIYDVRILGAMVRHFEGPMPHIPEADLPYICRNMEVFFQQRDFADSRRRRPETEVFRKLTLDWRRSTPT